MLELKNILFLSLVSIKHLGFNSEDIELISFEESTFEEITTKLGGREKKVGRKFSKNKLIYE